MHMITPGIAAALTPTSTPRRKRRHGSRRLHLPRVHVHLPHPHLPHRHA